MAEKQSKGRFVINTSINRGRFFFAKFEKTMFIIGAILMCAGFTNNNHPISFVTGWSDLQVFYYLNADYRTWIAVSGICCIVASMLTFTARWDKKKRCAYCQNEIKPFTPYIEFLGTIYGAITDGRNQTVCEAHRDCHDATPAYERIDVDRSTMLKQ